MCFDALLFLTWAAQLLELLSASEEYLLPDLKLLCEHAATPLINPEVNK